MCLQITEMLWVLVNLILPSLEFISPQEPPGWRLPQCSGGFAVPMQEAWVASLVRELDPMCKN